MSMISSLIDELRERAKVLRQGRWSDGADDARLMEDAADTIWQLRDDLQRTNDAVRDAEHDESRAWDRVRKAEAENAKLRSCLSDDADNARQIMGENAKLRELASILWYCMQDRKDCDGCRLNGAEGELSYDPLCACDGLHEMMRELGVEVDG